MQIASTKMVTIEKIETETKRAVNRFIRLPFRLYANDPCWVPPLNVDARLYLNRTKFPYYTHSEAEFFVASKQGRDVGRIAVLEHRLFNDYHQTRQAQFAFFDCEEDDDVAAALFDRAFAWARERGLDRIIGPKGFGLLDSFGVLIQGFERRQMMGFTAYNHPYYRALVEGAGFQKEVDFISCQLDMTRFRLPDWVVDLADGVRRREQLTVENFTKMAPLVAAAPAMFQTYNRSFVDNWEFYPLPREEIDFLIGNLKPVAVPQLMKVIKHREEMVGLLFALPDLSSALQRARGRLNPLSIYHLWREKRRLRSAVFGAIAILEPYRMQGGNALLFAEIERTIRELGIEQIELVNMADTAQAIRRDLAALGIQPSKIHRVYSRGL